MANIKFNRKEFEKAAGKIEDVKEKIALFGTPIESVTDSEIEVEIFPNRPDLLSFHGYLRSFLLFLGKKSKSYKVNKPLKDYDVMIDSSVKQVRPFTACAILKNLKFNDDKIREIVDVQEKLHLTYGRDRKKIAIGIYPLEKIKLPITYSAEDPDKIKFVPLEMDKEMTGKQILSRHPKGRDYAHLLKDAKKYPVFRDSKGEVLSMPPIINSHLTGKITEQTKDVFIECSGHDFHSLSKTLNILVTLLADMGGEVYAMNLQYDKKIKTPDLSREKTKINVKECEKLLGIKLKESDVKKLLSKMGHSYSKGIVESPAYRTDILHPVDIYEDVAVAYGYDKFIPELPEVFTIGSESEREIKKRKIAEILVGLGFLEISSYHLVKKDELKRVNIKEAIEVLESKTEYSHLRPNLMINSLKVLSENTDAKYPQKIFEIGKVFEEPSAEKEKLCISISGETDFTEIKQSLDYLMRMLDIKYNIEETQDSRFIEGRVGRIKINNKEMGVLGEISPLLIKNLGMKMPVSSLEIGLDF
jgi:phenylalanyl-tRNA synthetase beta chain